jgi:nitric oxide dioxygenase
MTPLPPLRLDPTPLFDPSAVQHVVVTEHARHVTGQTQGTILLQTDRVRQMLLAVPAGLTMPRHRATCDVTLTVAAGTGMFTGGDAEPVALRPGVHLFIPARTPHAVEATTDLTLVATFADAAPEIQFDAPA